jgi:hypothetical protein
VTARVLTPTGAFRAWYAVLVVVVACVASAGASIGYTAQSVHRSDQQWCDLLRSLDQPLPTSPPPTDRQVIIARQMHALRVGKGC